MHTLNSTDWQIFLLYLFCVFAVGVTLRSKIKTGKDFFQAGRAMPALVCMLAFAAASIGVLDVIAMGAAGAEFGFRAGLLFMLGAAPALVFAGLYLMPVYYRSAARTLPEYLGLRFDAKTRALAAGLQLTMAVATAGVSLWLIARIFQALRIFDALFYGYGWPLEAIFTFCVIVFAALVLIYVLFAGLRGTMVNHTLQFAVLVAGFLPVSWWGLASIGGWRGLKASAAAWSGQGGNGGTEMAAACIALGLLFGAGKWITDFRILQMALAAKTADAARWIPVGAAGVLLFVPFLLMLPGAIAIGLPTPQNAMVVHSENGAIFHEITVVPREIAHGQGWVPARMDAAKDNAQLDEAGKPLLLYGMATPNMMMHFLPVGFLGLGIAALLACLMSGVAASVTAASTVFCCDLFPMFARKVQSTESELATGRWAAVGAGLLSIAVAYAAAGAAGAHGGVPDALVVLLGIAALLQVPQMGTFLLGVLTKRATGHGAFAGLAAGIAAAVLHYDLTIHTSSAPGLSGAWIAVAHRYPSAVAQWAWTAVAGLAANLVVGLAVSFAGAARPVKELKALVYSTAPRTKAKVWWRRPEALAVVVLAAAVLLAVVCS